VTDDTAEGDNAQAFPAAPASVTAQDQASRKEQYELLHRSMEDAYSGLIDFEFKQAAALTVALGWFITSEGARTFISGNHFAKYSIVLTVLLLTCFHYKWVRTYRDRNHSTLRLIKALRYMPDELLVSREIHPFTVISFSAFHAALAAVLCVLVLTS
jgi:hypothetical protein